VMSRITVASATSRKVANVFTVMDTVCMVVIVARGGGSSSFGDQSSPPCLDAAWTAYHSF
jgi:hypothetical protein